MSNLWFSGEKVLYATEKADLSKFWEHAWYGTTRKNRLFVTNYRVLLLPPSGPLSGKHLTLDALSKTVEYSVISSVELVRDYSLKVTYSDDSCGIITADREDTMNIKQALETMLPSKLSLVNFEGDKEDSYGIMKVKKEEITSLTKALEAEGSASLKKAVETMLDQSIERVLLKDQLTWNPGGSLYEEAFGALPFQANSKLCITNKRLVFYRIEQVHEADSARVVWGPPYFNMINVPFENITRIALTGRWFKGISLFFKGEISGWRLHPYFLVVPKNLDLHPFAKKVATREPKKPGEEIKTRFLPSKGEITDRVLDVLRKVIPDKIEKSSSSSTPSWAHGKFDLREWKCSACGSKLYRTNEKPYRFYCPVCGLDFTAQREVEK